MASAAPPGSAADVAPSARRVSVRAYHALTRMLLSCPYRDHRCGCNLPTCHAGYGDHDDGRRASRGRCNACLRSTWALDPPPAVDDDGRLK